MQAQTTLVFTGLWIILVTWLIQWAVAAAVKAKQADAVPGKIPQGLSHDSLVFRCHRTFMNSLENVPMFVATVFLALFLGLQSEWFGYWVVVFAVARILHMILYYAIATEKNPSPRSWFFALGAVANIAILVQCAMQLWSMY
ncbi:MAPEG family protein [Pseudidiomarina terrestris]|uniref:MAPEG family protein n=1 Tax=Pseudidiomarina terrestris TaxID=2820060 RepID=A0AAW7QZA9_9GAMM|nr:MULTISPECIES: MAPEG family protein [unclassified Pseudidiomarina]MDN7125531.1 MAPEG family protein [Pseudidiomarina sp. 1APP75-32.1]MDN7126221.1 MAPEG family protein [Pseudidiomarina sp. 1APR75-33.1]MDN7130606.1 MAPEG family protein [Pseudidiomarina sp. 1APR75-15]MDN7134246.1 MAPEG family protein [Pseudidiomarina sp. 1ASP75-5]MDN7137066.1 MAPEG family protein [Pseudidiomarina sp. 1ASP75-14]